MKRHTKSSFIATIWNEVSLSTLQSCVDWSRKYPGHWVSDRLEETIHIPKISRL